MTAALDTVRFVDQADVYKKGQPAATLTRTAEGVEFAYTRGWLADGGPAVATTLPVTAGPVARTGGALPAFFSGLLPEGRRLGALRRQVKTSADDELSLLLAVGADTIGDVQVMPPGQPPGQVRPRLEVDDFSEVDFSALLAELGIRAERTALPGVQDKVSAAMLNVPVVTQGRRYILKLTPPEYPHLVSNEFCFLRAARLAGIDVAAARLVTDAHGELGLLVERFDRLPNGPDNPPSQLAVEDACQVAGLAPADKYLLSAERTLGSLSAVCRAALPAARTFLTQLVFAYLSGNGDAHAKNFAVLQTAEGEWRPTPAYDLPSSRPYGDTTMALRVNGRTDDLFVGDFVSLATTLGLPERAANRVLSQQAERVDAWLPLVAELPFDVAVTRKLAKVVAYRRDRIFR